METTDPVIGNETDQTVHLLQETAKLRKIRARISGATALIILLLLTLLFVDGYFFIKSYDKNKVIEALKAESPRVMNSLVMKNLTTSIRNEIIPKYVGEFSKKLKVSEPILRHEGMLFLGSISTNIGPAVQKKIVADLSGILLETKLLLKEKHPELTEADIASILETMQVEVEKQYTQRIQEQVCVMFQDINDKFSDLRKTATYATLEKRDTADLERMLLTTSLELLIYEIDPEEGSRVKGGCQ
jgi:hypothetical protein